MTSEQRNSAFKDTVLGIVAETVEFLDRVNWKMHVHDRPYERSEQVMEVIDIFKYALNLLVYMDIEQLEFHDAFIQKSQLVLNRFVKEFPDARDAVEKAMEQLDE